MTHEHLDLAARLRAAGRRMTPQRQIVLDALCAAGPHATAEEVYEHVHRHSPAVHRATVYRVLNTLEELRIIETARVGGRLVYEIVGGEPHHHLLCRACGATYNVGPEPVAAFLERLEAESGYRLDARHLVLEGLCPRCQENTEPGRDEG